jgi:hypothetical protein
MSEPSDPVTNAPWKPALTSQFLAAIDMLENAVRACPAPAWADAAEPVERQFWYLTYHTLFWLDCYLADREEGFTPPAPFDLGEWDPAGVYPERVYTPEEMLRYLEHGRRKCRVVLTALDDGAAAARCGVPRHDMSVLELHLQSVRHVQHHAAQLQWLLRQHTGAAPRWVGRGRDN